MKNEISVREKPANIVLKRSAIANITDYKYRFDNNLKTNKMAVRLFWDLNHLENESWHLDCARRLEDKLNFETDFEVYTGRIGTRFFFFWRMNQGI